MSESKNIEKQVPKKNLLSALYVVLYVAMPAVLLLLSLGFKENNLDPRFEGWSRMLFYFVALPIYVVYASMIFKRVASLTSKWMLFLFLPQLVNLGWNIYNHYLSTEILNILVLDGITTFCGIYCCLILGLIYLIYINSAEAYKKEGLGVLMARILVTIMIIGSIFTPVLFFFLKGWSLSLGDATTLPIWTMTKYIFSVVLVMFAHYPVIIELYKEGKF